MPTMDYPTIRETVERDAGLGSDDADQALRATLATLAERLTPKEASDLAPELPAELQRLLARQGSAEVFAIEEFAVRVAAREGVVVEEAERHVHAVFAALDLQQRLAPPAPDWTGAQGTFLARVAERGALDDETARRATEAVLATLGERITAGEADDVARELAPELRRVLLL
jgi:uncharacterized protein (DUF2267 family)